MIYSMIFVATYANYSLDHYISLCPRIAFLRVFNCHECETKLDIPSYHSSSTALVSCAKP